MSLAYTRLKNILSQKRNDEEYFARKSDKIPKSDGVHVGNGIVERGDDTPQTSVKSSQHQKAVEWKRVKNEISNGDKIHLK